MIHQITKDNEGSEKEVILRSSRDEAHTQYTFGDVLPADAGEFRLRDDFVPEAERQDSYGCRHDMDADRLGRHVENDQFRDLSHDSGSRAA